ncbi:MAG: GAF domain-containing protein, partial [Chloroflexota bacterium]
PEDYVHIANIDEFDERVDAQTLAWSKQFNTKALCVIPLYFAGAWQGIISVSWYQPHKLSPIEKYVLQNARDAISAVIANRRTRLAEQKARQETEQLYAASQGLNRSANNLIDILAVTASLIPEARVSHVFMLTPEFDEDGSVYDLETRVTWSESPLNIMPTGARVGNSIADVIQSQDQVIYYSANDETVDRQITRLLKRLTAESMCRLPLRLGPSISGYLFLCSSKANAFTQENIWILESIAPQIAVAVQNSSLLAEAQARARREELLREISEKIRSGADIDSVMKTAVSEIGRVLGRKAFLYLKTPGSEEDILTNE